MLRRSHFPIDSPNAPISRGKEIRQELGNVRLRGADVGGAVGKENADVRRSIVEYGLREGKTIEIGIDDAPFAEVATDRTP